MYRIAFIFFMGFLSLIGIACQQTVDLEKEKSEIMKLHEDNNQAILNADVEMMLSVYPEGSISVNGGEVSKGTREERKQIFERIFNSRIFWKKLLQAICSKQRV